MFKTYTANTPVGMWRGLTLQKARILCAVWGGVTVREYRAYDKRPVDRFTPTLKRAAVSK